MSVKDFDTRIGEIQIHQPYGRREVAALLNVCWDTVTTMIKAGKLATIKVGKRDKVLGHEILRFIGSSAPPIVGYSPAERKRRRDETLKWLKGDRVNPRAKRRPPQTPH